MDPRAGVSVVWGSLHAGAAPNVIPDHGLVSGTVRILDAVAWADCEDIVRAAVADIVRPYGVDAEIDYQRGVPPVVERAGLQPDPGRAVRSVLGDGAQVAAPQSLGGEDFGWFLERIPGAMMRLGTRTPGGATYDLHQGDLRVDERASASVRGSLAETAVVALSGSITTSVRGPWTGSAQRAHRVGLRVGQTCSPSLGGRSHQVGSRGDF